MGMVRVVNQLISYILERTQGVQWQKKLAKNHPPLNLSLLVNDTAASILESLMFMMSNLGCCVGGS